MLFGSGTRNRTWVDWTYEDRPRTNTLPAVLFIALPERVVKC